MLFYYNSVLQTSSPIYINIDGKYCELADTIYSKRHIYRSAVVYFKWENICDVYSVVLSDIVDFCMYKKYRIKAAQLVLHSNICSVYLDRSINIHMSNEHIEINSVEIQWADYNRICYYI
jgi:hypothetical protein